MQGRIHQSAIKAQVQDALIFGPRMMRGDCGQLAQPYPGADPRRQGQGRGSKQAQPVRLRAALCGGGICCCLKPWGGWPGGCEGGSDVLMTRCCGFGFGIGRCPCRCGFFGKSFGFEMRSGGACRFGFLLGTTTGLLRSLLFRRGTGRGGRCCGLRGAGLFCGPFGRALIGCCPRHCCILGLSFGFGLPGARGGGIALHSGTLHGDGFCFLLQRGPGYGGRSQFGGLPRLARGGFGGFPSGLDS